MADEGFCRPGNFKLLEAFIPIKHAFAGRNDIGEEPAPDVIELPETIGLQDVVPADR